MLRGDVEMDEIKSIGTLKRGAWLAFAVTLIDNATSAPLTGAAASLKCTGKYQYGNSAAIGDMDISETSTPGTYLFQKSSAVTKTWTANTEVIFDILYTTEDGKPIPTETFSLYIEEAVTVE